MKEEKYMVFEYRGYDIGYSVARGTLEECKTFLELNTYIDDLGRCVSIDETSVNGNGDPFTYEIIKC